MWVLIAVKQQLLPQENLEFKTTHWYFCSRGDVFVDWRLHTDISVEDFASHSFDFISKKCQ